MFNVRLAGGHLYGKQLFTWLSLVMSLMASFVLSFFPLDVLDEIWDLIESVSKGFLTYSSIAQNLLSSSIHRLYMTEILLERSKNANYPSIIRLLHAQMSLTSSKNFYTCSVLKSCLPLTQRCNKCHALTLTKRDENC